MLKTYAIIAISFLLMSTVWAKSQDDFTYDGQEESHSVHLSQVYADNRGVPSYQVRTEARLHFEEASREIGREVQIYVGINKLDIGMEASRDQNVLSLLKFRSSDRDVQGQTWNVVMDVDIKFIPEADTFMYPYITPIQDTMVLDDYLSFTIGKMENDFAFAPHVTIVRKKSLRSDEVIYDQTLTKKDWTLTEFGRDRTLVTVDLARVLTQVERGKKHSITVTIAPSLNGWRLFTKGSRDILANPPTSKVDTTFRYSNR